MVGLVEKVSLIKAESYQINLKDKICELLEPLGGLKAFCKPGERVLLKANFILPRSIETAATTHPAIILAVASLLRDMGCSVAVGDSPGIGSAESVVRKIGIYDELRRLHVDVAELTTPVAVPVEGRLTFEPQFKNLLLAKEAFDYDKVINLPKLKSHGQMGITLATKNLYGCVPGMAKGQWHFAAGRDLKAFARLLVEIALTVKPDLHILDGIIGMDGNGPSNGRPRALKLLAASPNPIALDRVIVELIGKQPGQFPIFEAANTLKIPGLKLEDIEVCGAPLDACRIDDFQIPALAQLDLVINPAVSKLIVNLIRKRLVLNKKTCIACRKCEEHCPAQAIDYHQGIRIDTSRCILCCCCQEMCPVGALHVNDPWLIKLFRKS